MALNAAEIRLVSFLLSLLTLSHTTVALPIYDCTSESVFVADDSDLCIFYQCFNGEPAVQPCAKGTRLPSYYQSGVDNPCTVMVTNDRCLRCDINDTLPQPDEGAHYCTLWKGVCDPCACVDQVEGYYCDCDDTARPEMPTPPNNPIASCARNVCLNGGTCQKLFDEKPLCICPYGYTGDVCERKLCDYNPCKNGGQCVSNGTAIHCECTGCYTGDCCDVRRTDDPDCIGCGPCEAGADCSKVRTWLCSCNPCPDGELCSNTPINTVRRCSKASGASSNKFTLVFEENWTTGNAALEMYATSGEDDNTARIVRAYAPWSTPDCSYDETQTIAPGQVHKFNVPICLRHDYSGQQQSGIRVIELNGKTITLYAINRATFSADSWLCLPDATAGRDFIVVTYPGFQTFKSQFAIVAIYNDTQITIVNSVNTDVDGTTPGVPYDIVLNECETFQVQADQLLDLTGSVVRASKPVHVIAGHVRAYVPPSSVNPLGAYSGTPSRDNLVEEIIPVQYWGTTYAIVPGLRNMIGYDYTEVLIRVLGYGPTACTVYSSDSAVAAAGPQVLQLSAPLYLSELYVNATPNYFINCSQAVLVMMLTESALQQISPLDDPSFIYVPAVTQYTNLYRFAAPIYSVTGGPYQYVVALLAARAADYAAVTINRVPPSPPHVKPWSPLNVPNNDDEVNYPRLYGGVFYLPRNSTSDIRHSNTKVTFMCIVYAFDDRESVGHAAGTSLSASANTFNLTLF